MEDRYYRSKLELVKYLDFHFLQIAFVESDVVFTVTRTYVVISVDRV